MDDVIATLDRLLEHERSAALQADVDALVELQERKSSLIGRLTQSHAEDDRLQALRERASANVQLIRHLVACLNGILMSDGTTYTAQGRHPSSCYGRSRGHL